MAGVEGGTEDEIIGVEAKEVYQFVDEVVDVQDESGYGSCLADTASVGDFEQGGGCDQVVEMLDPEGSRLSEDVQNGHGSVKENRERRTQGRRVTASWTEPKACTRKVATGGQRCPVELHG